MSQLIADLEDLGIEVKPGTVLDTRDVGTLSDGTLLQWQLKVVGDYNDLGRLVLRDDWKPTIIHAGGKIEEALWMPLPGSQHVFLSCPVFEALYEGTRGPGKTLTLLMDFAKDVGKGHGNAWRGILFRKTFGDLDDVVRKIEEWFYKLYPGFRFLKSKSEYSAIWPTGEVLLLRNMESENDYEQYHGHEYPWIGWEELSQWENDKAFKLMFSCCRPPRAGVPCRIRATTNPYGPGHNWIKKRYKLPHKCGQVIQEPGEMPRVAIHGALVENFLLLHSQPNYPIQVKQAAKNAAQAAAWLHGSWDVTAGGMIDDLWDARYHVIPDIPAMLIPRGWTITRSYDHGQSHPFACGWWLESNGEPMQLGNRLIGRVRGDLILWKSWYGTTGGDNEGLRMAAKKIAEGIRDRQNDWGVARRVIAGPADSEIYNKDSDRNGRCPADDMADIGITWERADKSRGSRKRGYEMLRTRLTDAVPNPDGTREKPGIFVCEGNQHWIELVPPIPRDEKDPDDSPEKYEDHLADMTRYRLNWEVPSAWRRAGF